MGIGNIGATEFIVILALVLIFFGPHRLPGIAQAIGKSLREFQKALNEVKSEIAQAGREADAGAELKRIMPQPSEMVMSDLEGAESDTHAASPQTPKPAEQAAAPPPADDDSADPDPAEDREHA